MAYFNANFKRLILNVLRFIVKKNNLNFLPEGKEPFRILPILPRTWGALYDPLEMKKIKNF